MKKFLLLVIFITITSCGSISYQTANTDNQENIEPSINTSEDTSQHIFVFATDYQSSGQLYKAILSGNETSLVNSGLTLLGTEAKIKLYDDLLYILHAGAGFNSISTDNLQIVDPYDDTSPYNTIAQYSTGNGTNPQDVVIDDNMAYISLYNPTNDSTNLTDNNQPGDVIALNTNTGIITHRFSFYDYLADDGDKNAHAANMVLVDDILYVALQDLESNTFSPTAPGKIGMIEVNTNTVLGVITLQSRNPYDMKLSPDSSKLFISAANDYSYDGTYGGLEIVNLNTQETITFIPDNEFEGYVEKVTMGNNQAFLTVAKYNLINFTFESKIISVPLNVLSLEDTTTFLDYKTDIRCTFFQDGYLWVSYRTISTTTGDTEPSIKVYDINTAKQIGDTLYPAVAGVSIGGG